MTLQQIKDPAPNVTSFLINGALIRRETVTAL
jgi:hypothetical protein